MTATDYLNIIRRKRIELWRAKKKAIYCAYMNGCNDLRDIRNEYNGQLKILTELIEVGRFGIRGY